MSRCARWAAPALAGLVVAGVVAALPAQGATTPPWRVWHVFPPSSGTAAVTATGPRDAWAAGYQCDRAGHCGANPLRVEHWNGTVWKSLTPPAGPGPAAFEGGMVTAITASSPANAWVVTDNNLTPARTVAQHWTGRGWAKPTSFPAGTEISAAVTSGPRDAWAFGAAGLGTSMKTYAAHFNGARWTRVSFPAYAFSASELSARDIWVVGFWNGKGPKGASPIAVEHLTGGAWHTVRVPAFTVPKGDGLQGDSLVADGPDDVWVIAGYSNAFGPDPGLLLLHWNGKTFTRVKVPYSRIAGPYFLTGDGAGGFWLAANMTVKTTLHRDLIRYDDGHWTPNAVPDEPKNETWVSGVAWIPGTRSAWAVGTEQSTIRYTGESQGVILKYGP